MRMLPIFCMLVAGAVAGCGSTTPTVSDTPYRGPTVSLGADGGIHEVRLEAPTGGWSLIVDQVVQRRGGYDIYATVRRPDGRYLHSQALVTHRATTTLAVQTPVQLCVRELAAEEPAETQEYAKVKTN